ncbi:MAG: hypothetical protein K0V04_15020 [Deltaproteobacteria bacterium]|nr:hypothetical protein [Deltaproteobacteria bacterium]
MSRLRAVVGLFVGLSGACAATTAAGPAAPAVDVPARDRSTDDIENLVAFARLYGYVRFFHPTDASRDADWAQLAIAGVQQVRDAPTLGDLSDDLQRLFEPLAPSLQLWVEGQPIPAPQPVPSRRDGLVYWQYQGFPGTPVSLHTPPYSVVRVDPEKRWRRRFSASPAPDTRVQTFLAPQLQARLPVVLGTAQTQPPPGGLGQSVPSTTDPHDHRSLAVRQAAVIEVWNVLRHFYPYQHELELDWEAMLIAALRDAEDDQSLRDVRNTLRGLLEPLHDGHGYVGHRGYSRQHTVPVRIELIEGKPVVTGTRDPEKFQVGDIVERIDGEPALPRIHAIAERLSGTPQWREFRAAAWEALAVAPEQRRTLQLERNGERHTVFADAEREEIPAPPRPSMLHTFEDGVVYVDLTRAKWSDIEPHLPTLAEAPGVVFDLRGYPSDNDNILDHLLREPEDALWMHVPRFVEPNGRVVGWHDLGWHRRPRTPHIAAPVSFLISADAISYGESMLSYVEAHHLGTLVGTTTAGANGDIVRFDTVAGFYVIYSGMRVTRHDGSPFHRGGVAPNVEIHRTVEGLRQGNDEVLEAGLDVVRRGQRPPNHS